MALTIDENSIKFSSTQDPSVFEVTLDYTNDDVERTVKDWEATWKTVRLLWNKNEQPKNFLGAVEKAIAAAAEKEEHQTIKAALIAATGQCKNTTRKDPEATDPGIPGTSADNPLFVKVVS